MKKKILVIDDDESILDAISLVLEEQFEVATTLKSGETYTKVCAFHPDLIILDVLMSGNDGRTICKNLKQDAETKKIPVLMISAHPTAQQGALEAGADAFLAKRFDVDQLLKAVSSLIHA